MKPQTKLLAYLSALAVAALALWPTTTHNQFKNSKLSRGLRNNNPGNLRKSAATWLGKVVNPLERDFESFSTMDYGVRAAIRNAFTQWNKGKDSIQSLVSIWAPPSENNTAAYVAAVAKAAGIPATSEFKWGGNDTTAKIMFAIFKHENGADTTKYITLAQVRKHLDAMWPNG
jgi:hypothetical protein